MTARNRPTETAPDEPVTDPRAGEDRRPVGELAAAFEVTLHDNELDMLVDWQTARRDFLALKEAEQRGEITRTDPAYKAAKARASATRQAWREIRSFVDVANLTEFLATLPDDDTRRAWLGEHGYGDGDAITNPDVIAVLAALNEKG